MKRLEKSGNGNTGDSINLDLCLKYKILLLTSNMTRDINRAELRGAFLRPKGIHVNSQCPEEVENAVSF